MMIGRALLCTVMFATPPLAADLRAPAQDPAPDDLLRYGRIDVDGARVRNLADDKGLVVAELERGALLAVVEELATGWLLVEVPGGYAVWVYGRYLAPTADAGVFEVTSNAVNLRPRPSSDVTNFPLPQRLRAGDRVRVIELAEPEKPLAQNWARIWSPPGVRAWIRASATVALAEGEDGARLWAEALRLTPEAPPTRERRAETAAAAAADAAAQRELGAARGLLEAERAKETPDYAAVRTAYDAILARTSDGPVALQAQMDLEQIVALEQASVLSAELEEERRRRAEEVRRERERIIESSRRKDPLGSVFDARGVLVRRVGTEGVPSYHLRFGGQITSEIICPSGRYDLDLFAGYEVGVKGQTLASVEPRPVPVIAISRLEIIARR